MSKSAIDAPRINTFLVKPEDLTLITDKAHTLYDSRIELPINDGLVRSIVATGFHSTIEAFKDGEKIVVIDGRQRVRAAIKANEIRREKGQEPVSVRVQLKKATEAELFAVQLLLNENRQEDSDLTRAKNLSRMIAFGVTEESAGAAIGLSPARTKQILALLDLSSPVQKAVEAGKISTTAAVQLVKLERAAQTIELEKLFAESGGKRVRVRQTTKAVKKVRGKDGQDPPSRKQILALLEWSGAGLGEDARAALIWVTTGKLDGSIAKEWSMSQSMLKTKKQAPKEVTTNG